MTLTSATSRSLHRLIYFSRSGAADENFSETVEAIVRRSIHNNRRDNISGLLFCHDGWFLQALEGPAMAVQTALGRIGGDPRHSEIQVVAAGPAETRLFREWDMCARTLSMADNEVARTLQRRGPFEPSRLSAAAATRLLTTVRTVRDAAALRVTA